MKILAAGDLHFDEHSRFAECIRVHGNIVEMTRRESPDLFIIPGDIYERASTPKERDAVAEFVTALADVCPVVITQGNHDRHRELRIIAKLKTKHPVTVVEDARVVYAAGAAIAAMAWPDRASILAAAGLDGDPDALARDGLRAVIAGLGAELKQHDGPRIAAGHFMVDGALTSTGQPLLGQPINVGLSDLALFGASLGVMGHIHRAAEFDVEGNPFFYTGSPYRTDFGQLEPKTILLAEFEGLRLVRTATLDTGATPMVHLAGEWSEEEKTIRVEWDEEQVAGAEVRLCYRVPRDQRLAARGIAQEYRRALLECGALEVKNEEDLFVVKRSKALSVARSRSIAEKLPHHWTSIGFDPGARREALLVKAARLEELAGANPTAPTWMRLHKWQCRAMGPIRGEWGFDLDQYPMGSIIGLTGPNGTGKSFSLETSIGGTCFRRMPNHGTLVSRARARDSYSEGTVTAGNRTFTIRHTADAVSGKSETLVLNEQGAPEYAGASVRAFDAFSAKYLPHPEVLYAVQYAVQPGKKRRPRFIDLDSAERISVLLQVIGVEHIEQMAALARAEVSSAEEKLLLAQQRLDDERERVGDTGEVRAALRAAEATLTGATEALTAARGALRETESALARVEAQNAAVAERQAQRAEVERRLTRARDERDELQRRVTELAEASSRREELKSQAERLDGLRKELASAQAALDAAKAIRERNEAARVARRRLESEETEARVQFASLARRLEETASLCASAEDIRRAVAREGELRSELAELNKRESEREFRHAKLEHEFRSKNLDLTRVEREMEALIPLTEGLGYARQARAKIHDKNQELQAAESLRAKALAELEKLSGLRIAGAEERIDGLRGALGEIAEGGSMPMSCAGSALAADDRLVQRAEELPKQIELLKEKLFAAEKAVAEAKQELGSLERLAEKVPELERALCRLIDARDEKTETEKTLVAIAARLEESRLETKQYLADLDRIDAEAEELAPLTGQLSALERAETLSTELQAQAGAIETRARELAQRVAEPLVLEEEPSVASVSELLEQVDAAEDAARSFAAAEKAATQLAEVEPQATRAVAETMRLELSLLEFGTVDLLPLPDVATPRARVEELEAAERAASSEVGAARARLDATLAQQARIPEIGKVRDESAAEVADWKRLALDLGRGGIQSAEVDSAGPELTELTNELLRACHGPRFTVSVDSSRLSADGKKQVDEFLLNVLDSNTGDPERDAAEFSGGERVILGESIENALLILGCLRADARHPTIVRDESMPALDEANMRAYPLMLRHVVEKTQAAQLLLVTHSSELRELCDFQILAGSRTESTGDG